MISWILFGRNITPLVWVRLFVGFSHTMGNEGLVIKTLATFMLSTQNVAWGMGISNAELIYMDNLKPITSPMSSSRGMLIALSGDYSRVFDPVRRAVIEPSE